MAVENRFRVVFRFATFEVDPQAGELRKQGLRVRIQEQPFRLLVLLLQRPGEVLTREELRSKIWPADTFIDFDKGLNTSVNRLREALGDSSDNPRFVETIPKRGYRFIGAVTTNGDSLTVPSKTALTPQLRMWTGMAAAAILVIGVMLGSGYSWRLWRSHRLTERDQIVLADIINKTGDPVFDGALRQGLEVQLEQSPFLSLVSQEQVQQTLRFMKKPRDAPHTPESAWEVCQRTNSTIVLFGSISQLGNKYSLVLRASNCANAEFLASTEAQAADKNHVLDALGKASSDIRQRLGESGTNLQKFDTPLEQASTASLDALRLYSLGFKATTRQNDSAAAKPLFQRAIELDPNFAMAHVLLGTTYWNLGENRLASESIQRAFELRTGVSERERLRIETEYHCLVTCDLIKCERAQEVWAQTYPRDPVPRSRLGMAYLALGQPDKAAALIIDALRLYPQSAQMRSNLIYAYIASNRIAEAHAVIEEARAQNPDAPGLRVNLYRLAFLKNDRAAMEEQVAFSNGKPGLEDELLWNEAATVDYFGQVRRARAYNQRAIMSAERADEKETAKVYQAYEALTEAFLGYRQEARRRLAAFHHSTGGPDMQYDVALTLALTGDTSRAAAMVEHMAKAFPEDTVVQFLYLPILRAQLALSQHDAAKAIEILQAATPFELSIALHALYFRGLGYLAAHRGNEAAGEFQKILSHPGVSLNSPVGALAHLQLARAFVVEGERGKATTENQNFLNLWKDADSDIPILKQAQREYSKVR